MGEDGKEHLVAFASQKLLPRKTHYAAMEKECLAIVWALNHFHPYLFGQRFTVETDHRPLSWLNKTKSSSTHLARWALAVQPYKFDVQHRKGSQNGSADGLSRGPEVDMDSLLLSQGGRDVTK